MKADSFYGAGVSAVDELDLAGIDVRITDMVTALHRIAPEHFTEAWYDTNWYVANKGAIPEQLLELSDPKIVRLATERGQRDPVTAAQLRTGTRIGLRTPSDIPFQMEARVGGFAGTSSNLLLMIDARRYGLPLDQDWLLLTDEQIRAIVILLARVWSFSEVMYEVTGERPIPQVNLPAVTDIVARRKARGPGWKGLLGWFTYLDTNIWEVDIDESALPPGVLVEPALNGVTIQLGDDHANVPELLIAQTRRAIGWEYRRDVLPT